jgi:hypothetical protein
MGGQGTTQTTNQVSQTQLPPWVSNAAQQNYAMAQNVANRPIQQYQGQQIAGVAPQQQQSWDLAASMPGANAAPYNEANAGYLGVMGQGAPQVTAGALANTNLSPYMNPYTQSVINTTLPIMQQNLQQSEAQNQSNATAANAFGGSRLGVQQGVTQAQGALNMANMAAGLNQSNFAQAQAGATGDLQRQLAAGQGNQQAVLGAQQNQNVAAGGLANMANMQNTNAFQQYLGLQSAGQGEQAQAQNEIGANMGQFNQAWNYPTTQMNTLLASLGMTPYGQSQTTSGTQNVQTSTDPVQAALGGAQILGNLFFSDREAKTDIKKLGKQGGLDMYAYRYKGDPKSYPKVVGPMAQDIQKQDPSKVVSIAGKKAIVAGAGALASPQSVSTPFGQAKRAPDGNHYVQHPKTGKYLRVKNLATG